jgi:hypothetical protein
VVTGGGYNGNYWATALVCVVVTTLYKVESKKGKKLEYCGREGRE